MTESLVSETIDQHDVTGAVGYQPRRGAVKSGAANAWKGARKLPMLPTAIVVLFVIFAVFAPQLAPYDPTQISLTQKLKPPFFSEGGSTAHLLGTDNLGRDVLSRLIWGARVSLVIAAAVVVLSSVVGLAIGLAAGYVGGRTDSFLMRFADGSLAFPGILLALLFAISLGPGVLTVILALSILGWASYARIIRGEVLQMRKLDFIAQARVIGCSPARIMITHLLPNVFNVWVVMITLQIGLVVLAEATLGFLGAGVPRRLRRGVPSFPMGEISSTRRGGFRSFPGWRSDCWCFPGTTSATGCETRSIRGSGRSDGGETD